MVLYKESVIEHADLWVADSVDHNIITSTGKGTFHGMGLVSIHYSCFICSNSVPRLKDRKKTSSIIQNEIPKWSVETEVWSYLESPVSNSYLFRDVLWFDLANWWFLHSPDNPRPNWNDFTQKYNIPNSCEDIKKHKKSFNIFPTINNYQLIWWELHLLNP